MKKLALLIVAVLMLINGVSLHWSALLLPIYIFEIYLLALGLAFYLSALNVKYRDTIHIWEIIMQAAFYATPIIYPLSIVVAKSGAIAKLLLMNPVAQAIQDARYVLITKESITVSTIFNNGIYNLIPFAITIVIFIAGTLYFKRHSKYFAEMI